MILNSLHALVFIKREHIPPPNDGKRKRDKDESSSKRDIEKKRKKQSTQVRQIEVATKEGRNI